MLKVFRPARAGIPAARIVIHSSGFPIHAPHPQGFCPARCRPIDCGMGRSGPRPGQAAVSSARWFPPAVLPQTGKTAGTRISTRPGIPFLAAGTESSGPSALNSCSKASPSASMCSASERSTSTDRPSMRECVRRMIGKSASQLREVRHPPTSKAAWCCCWWFSRRAGPAHAVCVPRDYLLYERSSVGYWIHHQVMNPPGR